MNLTPEIKDRIKTIQDHQIKLMDELDEFGRGPSIDSMQTLVGKTLQDLILLWRELKNE